MVKVEDEPLPGEIVEGLKAQVKPAGAMQARVIMKLAPSTRPIANSPGRVSLASLFIVVSFLLDWVHHK
jgi:hypothetical protein